MSTERDRYYDKAYAGGYDRRDERALATEARAEADAARDDDDAARAWYADDEADDADARRA